MDWKYKVVVAYKRFKDDYLQVEERKFLTEKHARKHMRESRKAIKNFGFTEKEIRIVEF